jgi:hypothetical protein
MTEKQSCIKSKVDVKVTKTITADKTVIEKTSQRTEFFRRESTSQKSLTETKKSSNEKKVVPYKKYDKKIPKVEKNLEVIYDNHKLVFSQGNHSRNKSHERDSSVVRRGSYISYTSQKLQKYFSFADETSKKKSLINSPEMSRSSTFFCFV